MYLHTRYKPNLFLYYLALAIYIVRLPGDNKYAYFNIMDTFYKVYILKVDLVFLYHSDAVLQQIYINKKKKTGKKLVYLPGCQEFSLWIYVMPLISNGLLL